MTVQILKDAILETTTTQGTGALNLAGAQTGYNAMRDKFSDGDWVAYVIEQRQTDADGNLTGIDREVVLGKLTYGTPDTLARTYVISSTNADANVNFGAGTKDVFCAPGSSVFGWNLAGFESRTSGKTLTIVHNNLLLASDASGGAYTQNLPAGTDIFPGYRVGVIKVDSSANAITIDAAGGDTINGATTYTLSDQYESATFVWNGSEWFVESNRKTVTVPLPTLHKTGLTLSNNITDSDHDIDIAAGKARDSADAADIELSSALVKRIDASWVAGTNQGGLSSSLTLAVDTWYHVFSVNVGEVADVIFDTSITCANGVTDHSITEYRYIGSVLTDGLSNLYQFLQVDNQILWDEDIGLDYDGAPAGSSISITLSTPVDIALQASLSVYSTGNQDGHIYSALHADRVAAGGGWPLKNSGSAASSGTINIAQLIDVMTNTSSQIKYDESSSGTVLRIMTNGWRIPTNI